MMENKINLCTNEILTKIPSTAKLVFYKIAIEDANFEITPEWIEWAAELAQTQYKTPHIIELSHKTDMDDQIYLRGLTWCWKIMRIFLPSTGRIKCSVPHR